MKQLVVASTFYQCLSLAGRGRRGALPDADERILVLADGSQVPELTVPPADQEGFARGRGPASTGWSTLRRCSIPDDRCSSPRATSRSIPSWERLLRSHWRARRRPAADRDGLRPGEPRVLAWPASSTTPSCTTHSDGLMTYSPTRSSCRCAGAAAGRAGAPRPGAGADSPKLLSEDGSRPAYGPAPGSGAVARSRRCTERQPTVLGPTAHDDRPTALMLGQYLSSLRLLTPAAGVRAAPTHGRRGGEPGGRGLRIQAAPGRPTHDDPRAGRRGRAAGVELVVDTRAGDRRADHAPPPAAVGDQLLLHRFGDRALPARVEAVAVGTRRRCSPR